MLWPRAVVPLICPAAPVNNPLSKSDGKSKFAKLHDAATGTTVLAFSNIAAEGAAINRQRSVDVGGDLLAICRVNCPARDEAWGGDTAAGTGSSMRSFGYGGRLYGTTINGGPYDRGVVFELTWSASEGRMSSIFYHRK
jgi:uncharacterized repeat protein (TIGR03803 family)